MRGVSSAVVQVISELRSNESEREQLEMEAKNVELRQTLEPEEVECRLVALLLQRCTERQSWPIPAAIARHAAGLGRAAGEAHGEAPGVGGRP